MAFNELEAIKMIDEGKISDKEIKFLSSVRNGVAAEDVRDSKEFKELEDRGLVYRVPLSHPRANVSVDAVVPTEEGTTVLNLFDKRYRENAGTDPDANTAPNVDPKLVKHPTAEEARKVPSIEKNPLTSEQKPSAKTPEGTKEAMKDPLVKTGAKDVAEADTDNGRTVAKNATVKVEKR